MDKNIAIQFDGVGKQYRLGLVGTGSLQHDINRWWQTTILRKEDPYLKIGEVNDRSKKGTSDYVWALKDISFKVEQGDVVGIIGKNGAGKSTLLKLLSHITAPSTGHITYRGRIASLLEVGTGFHPEMTARDNIYMNGSIMGMGKSEIDRKLDEIVDFAGIERYLDTPVKRFSSGMTVRLGFAVAAFLEPEILVVDEVLAVGDAEFQKKAIGKMQEVSSGGGRTVLFVSHNMTAVRSLCKSGIILENGLLKTQGFCEDIVSEYLRGDSEISNHKKWEIPQVKNGGFELLEIGYRRKNYDWTEPMPMDQDIELFVRYRLTHQFETFWMTFCYKNEMGNRFLLSTANDDVEKRHEAGVYEQTCLIPANTFNWGNYSIDFKAFESVTNELIYETDFLSFAVANKPLPPGAWMGKEVGEFTIHFPFSEKKIE